MEIYHVLNRGVDKRVVFTDSLDYLRFVHDMYVFNNEGYVNSNHKRTILSRSERKPIVTIHAFCLMPNHYHMLLSDVMEGGISKFMKKLNQGYTQYFNNRQNRTGALWQGKYKGVLISNEAHFMYVPYYIHLNALDLSMPEWRGGGVRDIKRALRLLSDYRWSSHKDYIGVKNLPSVISKDFLESLLGDKAQYEEEIQRIITDSMIATQSNVIEG